MSFWAKFRAICAECSLNSWLITSWAISMAAFASSFSFLLMNSAKFWLVSSSLAILLANLSLNSPSSFSLSAFARSYPACSASFLLSSNLASNSFCWFSSFISSWVSARAALSIISSFSFKSSTILWAELFGVLSCSFSWASFCASSLFEFACFACSSFWFFCSCILANSLITLK